MGMRWKTVDVVFISRNTFWFEEDLVGFLVCKSNNLIFNRWTVTGPSTFNDPRIHGRKVQVFLDKISRFTRRSSDLAIHLAIELVQNRARRVFAT